MSKVSRMSSKKILVINATPKKMYGYVVRIREYSKKARRNGNKYEWKQKVAEIPIGCEIEPGEYVLVHAGRRRWSLEEKKT